MIGLRSLIVAFCALAAVPALAFQEQKQAAPSQQQQAAPRAEVGGTPSPKPQAAPTGTEIRIPGFGSVGVIPKIDFGLELLYGGADHQRQPAVPQPTEPSDGMAVRGSIKHKF